MKKINALLMAALLAGMLGGCASAQATPEATASTSPSATEENPYGGFPVDPPAANEVVLTVDGAKSIDYTLPQLKALVQVEETIYEPFVKKQQTFKGVEMAVLFEASGIKPTDKVDTVALNDYKYTDSASKFTDSKGFIALSRDGSAIGMDQGGPIRIVFPDGQKYSSFLDAWNWSIRSIEVAK